MKTIKITIILSILFLLTAKFSFSQLNKTTLNTNATQLLTLSITGNGYSDQADIMFDSTATNGFDNQFDMLKLFGMAAAPQFYSYTDSNLKLSINALPMYTPNLRVQLGLRLGYDTSYTIAASGINSFPSNTYICLKDSLLNTLINLNTNPNYTFNGHTTESLTRFVLYFYNTTAINNISDDSHNIYTDNNTIYVHSEKSDIIKEIEVYNLLGQVVYSKRIDDGSNFYKINMMNNEKNIYLVKIKSKTKTFTKKVILR